jgi:hypothetical protein
MLSVLFFSSFAAMKVIPYVALHVAVYVSYACMVAFAYVLSPDDEISLNPVDVVARVAPDLFEVFYAMRYWWNLSIMCILLWMVFAGFEGVLRCFVACASSTKVDDASSVEIDDVDQWRIIATDDKVDDVVMSDTRVEIASVDDSADVHANAVDRIIRESPVRRVFVRMRRLCELVGYVATVWSTALMIYATYMWLGDLCDVVVCATPRFTLMFVFVIRLAVVLSCFPLIVLY